MTMDLARLGVEIDSRKVKDGKQNLRDFGDEGVRTQKRIGEATDSMRRDFSKLGGNLKAFTRIAGGAFALIAGSISASAAIGEARKFGAALSEVSTLIEGNAQQTKFLQEETNRLAATYGGTGTSQAQAFYQAISAGASSVEEAAMTLDAANKLAIGGVTDVTTGVGILSTAMNVYSSSGLTAAEASDAIFVAVKAGVTTVGELSSSLGKVLPLAEKMGLSFDETAAATAALTKGGLSTAEAVTALRASLSAALGPSKQASDLAKQLGLDFSASAISAKGFAGFMQDVVDKTGGSSEKMQMLFGSVEAVGAALAFSGSAGESMNAILDDMESKAGATAEAYGKMSLDKDQRLQVALGKIWTLTAALGDALLTVFVPAMEAAGVLAQMLAENMDRLGVYFGVAAVALTAAYKPAIVAAAVATRKFAAGILFTRTALIRAGWGAAIVVIGELIFQLMRAKEVTGSWGTALVLLGDVAKGVWQGIAEAANAIPPSLASVWNTVKADFLLAISDMLNSWSTFVQSVATGIEGIPGMEGTFSTLQNKITGVVRASADFAESSMSARSAAKSYASEASSLASDGFDKAREALNKLNIETAKESTVTKKATKEVVDLNEALAGDGSSGSGSNKGTAGAAKEAGKAMKAAAKEAEKFAKEVEQLEFDANPMLKYNEELERLEYLVSDHGLSNGAFQKAVKDLNDELLNSYPIISDLGNAIGDFVASGLRDFDDLLSSFKKTIKEMVATAIANPIKLALVGSVGAGAAGAASAATGGAAPSGGGGLLSGLLGAGQGAGGGLLGGILGTATSGTGLIGGFSSVVSSLGMGGLGGAASSIGAALSGATTGLTGFATAIGAVAAPLLAVGAVFSFFKKKTKELDSGLQVTVNGMNALVQSFRLVEESRFFGLSKKTRERVSALDREAAEPFEAIVGQIQSGVLNAAGALGIGASAFKDFSATVKVSTKGMSDSEAQSAITEALTDLSDEFASLIPGISELQREGEGAYEAIQRLSSSIGVVNASLGMLDKTMYDMSLDGAAAASSLADAFGGLQNLTSATDSYYQNFYSESERSELLTRRLATAMNELGMAMPETRAELRALVDMQDLSTEAGRQMYAALVSLSSEFNNVLPAIDSLANKMGALAGQLGNQAVAKINDQIEASNRAAQQARNSATAFFRLADSLRSAASELRAVATEADFADARKSFNRMFLKAIGGDQEALGGLAASGRTLATDGGQFATSALEMGRLQADIRNKLNEAAAVSEAMGLGADYQAKLFDVQTAALENLRDLLESGDVTRDLLEEQIGVLNSIKNQISDSANLQIVTGKGLNGETVSALKDNGGRIVGSLSSEGSRYISSLLTQTRAIVDSMDANKDGIISVTESQTAAILSQYQSTVMALVAAVDRNGNTTVAQLRASLAGKASDAAIASVVNAVDRNKDGIITSEEAQAARIISNASSRTAAELFALGQQTLTFANAVTGQTVSVTGTQRLTNNELNKVQSLQGQTVSITELVERAVEGNANLTAALLSRLSNGINVAGVGDMVSGIGSINNLLARLIAAQEASIAAQQAEANKQRAIASAQAQLEATAKAQRTAISQVESAIPEIFSLANKYGVFLNANAGAARLVNDARFNITEQGLLSSQYGQISTRGGDAAGFKREFVQSGGVFEQTLGRAGELSQLASTLASQRDAIRALGGVPAFAMGGAHRGGLARVGENDMELVAPSRIYNPADTRRMLDNKPIVDAVKEMKEELRKFKDENAQMMINLSSDSRKMLRLEEKREEIGTPTYTVVAPS